MCKCHKILQGPAKRRTPGFGEFCYCSRLPLLLGFACSIHATWRPPFGRSLYAWKYARLRLLSPVLFALGKHSCSRVKGDLFRVVRLPSFSPVTKGAEEIPPSSTGLPMLRECCRQSQAEVVSKSRNKNSPNLGTAF